MAEILDVLHARCAEIAAEAILSGEEHPGLELTTHEVEELITHLVELHRRAHEVEAAYRELDHRHTVLRRAATAATVSLEMIPTVLEARTAHPEAHVRQACSIARSAARNLMVARLDTEGSTS